MKDKERVNTDGRVICTSCGKFSGWTNEDLIYIKSGKNLNCNNCGEVCIKLLDKNYLDEKNG